MRVFKIFYFIAIYLVVAPVFSPLYSASFSTIPPVAMEKDPEFVDFILPSLLESDLETTWDNFLGKEYSQGGWINVAKQKEEDLDTESSRDAMLAINKEIMLGKKIAPSSECFKDFACQNGAAYYLASQYCYDAIISKKQGNKNTLREEAIAYAMKQFAQYHQSNPVFTLYDHLEQDLRCYFDISDIGRMWARLDSALPTLKKWISELTTYNPKLDLYKDSEKPLKKDLSSPHSLPIPLLNNGANHCYIASLLQVINATEFDSSDPFLLQNEENHKAWVDILLRKLRNYIFEEDGAHSPTEFLLDLLDDQISLEINKIIDNIWSQYKEHIRRYFKEQLGLITQQLALEETSALEFVQKTLKPYNQALSDNTIQALKKECTGEGSISRLLNAYRQISQQTGDSNFVFTYLLNTTLFLNNNEVTFLEFPKHQDYEMWYNDEGWKIFDADVVKEKNQTRKNNPLNSNPVAAQRNCINSFAERNGKPINIFAAYNEQLKQSVASTYLNKIFNKTKESQSTDDKIYSEAFGKFSRHSNKTRFFQPPKALYLTCPVPNAENVYRHEFHPFITHNKQLALYHLKGMIIGPGHNLALINDSNARWFKVDSSPIQKTRAYLSPEPVSEDTQPLLRLKSGVKKEILLCGYRLEKQGILQKP